MISSSRPLLGFCLGIWYLPVLPRGMIVCVLNACVCVCAPFNGLAICPGCIPASQPVAAGIDSSSFSDFNSEKVAADGEMLFLPQKSPNWRVVLGLLGWRGRHLLLPQQQCGRPPSLNPCVLLRGPLSSAGPDVTSRTGCPQKQSLHVLHFWLVRARRRSADSRRSIIVTQVGSLITRLWTPEKSQAFI